MKTVIKHNFSDAFKWETSYDREMGGRTQTTESDEWNL